jgi:hypothetical protein
MWSLEHRQFCGIKNSHFYLHTVYPLHIDCVGNKRVQQSRHTTGDGRVVVGASNRREGETPTWLGRKKSIARSHEVLERTTRRTYTVDSGRLFRALLDAILYCATGGVLRMMESGQASLTESAFGCIPTILSIHPRVNILVVACKSCIGNLSLLYNILTWTGHMNSLLNPLIYSRFSREFRRAFVKHTANNTYLRLRS